MGEAVDLLGGSRRGKRGGRFGGRAFGGREGERGAGYLINIGYPFR